MNMQWTLTLLLYNQLLEKEDTHMFGKEFLNIIIGNLLSKLYKK